MRILTFVLSLSIGLAVSGVGWSADSSSRKFPVVFAHGLGIGPEVYESLIPLKRVFSEHGYDVRVARTPMLGSIEERAEILNREIRRLVPDGRFHLVGHSMGGLDARLAIHRYGLGSRCTSLTTLSTPHRGSPVADYVVSKLDASGAPLALLLLKEWFAGDLSAVRTLTTQNMREVFNAEVRDDPRVRYFSMGFFVPSPVIINLLAPWLWFSHSIVTSAGAPENDALVSIESARWGEDLGAFAGDHYSETGPIPLGGKMIYQRVFERVLEHLDSRF